MRKRRITYTASPEYVVVGDIRDFKGKPVAIYDLDGVLIDSTERFNESLREAGVSLKEFRENRMARKRVWKIFLSEKYMHLDKPVEEAVEMLEKSVERGLCVVIITGRPVSMKRKTLEQLSRFNIHYNAVIFRNEGNFRKDYEYKLRVIRGIGLENNIVEAHDDSPEICYAYTDYAQKAVYYWHRIGEYLYIPPSTVKIDGKLHSLNNIKYSEFVFKSKKLMQKHHVEWLEYRYDVNDALELIGLLEYIRVVIGSANSTYSQDLVDISPYEEFIARIDSGDYGYIIINGEKYKSISSTDFDEAFSETVIEKSIYEYIESAIEQAVSELFNGVYSSTTYDLAEYLKDMFLGAVKIRKSVSTPPEPEAPKITSLDDLHRYKEKIKDLTVYTAFNLDKQYKFTIDPQHSVLISCGNIFLITTKPLTVPRGHVRKRMRSSDSLKKIIDVLREANEEVYNVLDEMQKLRDDTIGFLKKTGVEYEKVYVFIMDNSVFTVAKISLE